MFHPLRERVWRERAQLRPMRVFDALAPFAGRLADAVGAATDAEARVFRRAGSARVAMLPPVVLPAPVEPIAVADDFRRTSGTGAAPLVVLVASRDERRKGLDFARETFEQLEMIRPDARIAVVGLGPLRRPLPRNAVSLGRVDARMLTAAYRAADLVFVPSLFEAFSRVVIEAWQQETAVVVSDGVALAPVVATTGGTVVPYGDAVSAAQALAERLGDVEGTAAAGRAGRQLVEARFELSGLLDDVEELYGDLTRAARRRTSPLSLVRVRLMQPGAVAQPSFSATVHAPRSATGIAAFRRHAPGVGVLAALSLWLTRHWLESSAPPAGTDMLGFISRAKQNAAGLQAASLWSPANWGGRRAITLESLLGLMTRATGDPVVAVKLFALATLLAAGIFAYLFALRLFSSRVAATCAGILYMSSQGMLAHLASGHLNVEVAIATMPLMLMLWCESLERFSIGGASLLGGAAALTVLARPDLVLYVGPTMLVVVAVRVAIVPGWRATARNALLTAACAITVATALSLYLIVPTVAGIRARWLTTTSLFDPTQLLNRSVGAYASLLGFAREIGYLAFTGQQTWTGHPWLPFAAYAAYASCIVVLALGAAFVRPDARMLALLSAGVLATFMGKGLREPFGMPFDWAVRHVPVFTNLRDPNRWLLPQALVFSLLAGGMLAWIQSRGGRPMAALAGALLAVCLIPVSPTLLTGLRTVGVTPDQRAVLDRIARDPQPSLVASIPYDQTYRFVTQGSYAGWEHDLGSESFAATGHPAVGDGGWDQQAADTVAYTGTLLRERSPVFAPILGSLGVKYVVSFGYAPTDPHLIEPGLGLLYQQRSAASMPGLKHIAGAGHARLYRVRSFVPLVSFRPNIAVVLGGREGIGALASVHGINLRTWAVFTADDILAHGGVNRLLTLAHRARLLVVADASAHDLAVLSSTPVATLAGITSDPGLDQQSQIVPSDASIRSGAIASETAPVAQIGRTSSTKSFRLRHPRALDLWARIETGSAAADLTFTIDGKRVRTIEPLTPAGGGFRWFHVERRMFAAGRHELAVAATPSAFGPDFELDEARLTVPAQTAKLERAFRSLLAGTAGHTLYAFDPDCKPGTDLPLKAVGECTPDRAERSRVLARDRARIRAGGRP